MTLDLGLWKHPFYCLSSVYKTTLTLDLLSTESWLIWTEVEWRSSDVRNDLKMLLLRRAFLTLSWQDESEQTSSRGGTSCCFSFLCGAHLSPCEGPLPLWGFPGSPRSPWQRCWRSTSWETRRGEEASLGAPRKTRCIFDSYDGEKSNVEISDG